MVEEDSRFAVVDVETTGLSPRGDRMLSVAVIRLDADLQVEDTWYTLLNPGVDPGPVHVHGLTREVLADAPMFEDVVDELFARLDGRVLVAHNAGFDSGFLSAEAARVGRTLPVAGRLCTVVLARRLRLGLPSLNLASLARNFGVQQLRAHDALDDARVLVEIFRHLVLAAGEKGVSLTFLGERRRSTPPVVSLPPAPSWTPGEPLTPGLRVALAGYGPARSQTMRSILSDNGLIPTGATDLEASLFVVNGDPDLLVEVSQARSAGLPVLSEPELFALLTQKQAPV